MREIYQDLRNEIVAFFHKSTPDFGPLALRIFEFQFGLNTPYRAYCESLGLTPATVRSWADIPAVPSDAFKSGLPLSCFPPEGAERRFLTSGTSSETRGCHYLADLSLYREAVQQGWRHAGLPEQPRRLFLSREPRHTPESSLASMFEFLSHPDESSPWLLDEDGGIDLDSLSSASAPILLFSTALALRHLFDRISTPLSLPAGSWVFQTGGYKGLEETYDPQRFYEQIAQNLGVAPERVINEYGMTELSSQAYAIGVGASHRSPPWLKFRVIDPETNRPARTDQPGFLVCHDLANLGSVSVVRTQDLAVAIDDHTITLHGREPGATPRGCSRASDAFLQTS